MNGSANGRDEKWEGKVWTTYTAGVGLGVVDSTMSCGVCSPCVVDAAARVGSSANFESSVERKELRTAHDSVYTIPEEASDATRVVDVWGEEAACSYMGDLRSHGVT